MPIEPEEIARKLKVDLPGAQVDVTDLTGTEDHYRVTIVAPQFEGKTMLNQHRMIYEILHNDMEAHGGGIHALSLATYTPEQWQEQALKSKTPTIKGVHTR